MERPRLAPGIYLGLFLTTLSTLMYEVLLTRIFSVTMWYHFAFVAVSVALFGMTVGALIVYLLPERFPEERIRERLSQASLLFSVSIVVSFVTQLSIPFSPEWSVLGVYSVGLTYLVVSVPFIFSGIAVCLALTKFPREVSRLYAVDLVGAALGTLTLIWLLDVLKDGPSAVLATAAVAAVGAAFFAHAAGRQMRLALAGVTVLLLAGLALGNAVSVQGHDPILRVRWVKGEAEETPLFETWNAFSRVTVDGDPDTPSAPFGWGMSPAYSGGAVRQLLLKIDATAGTPLIHYDGSREQIDHLRYDVTNIAHYLRSDARVFIVGSGGGRDVLAAQAFDQPSVTAVEMNGAILDTANGRYGEFTGHLDRLPGVAFVNDEARSYLERSDDRFDIIQISLIDTWAATAAGAFALSENSLYTAEAWQSFLDHLTPDGVLTVSRWYYALRPMEAYRLTALASEALRMSGVDQPRDHIMFVKSPLTGLGVGVGTMLVSPSPFSATDVARIQQVSDFMQFEVALAPDREGADPIFAKVAETDDPGSISLDFPADITAPTDDRPFFFQMFRFQDLLRPAFYSSVDPFLAKPMLVLASLSVSVLGATLLFILFPLLVTIGRGALHGMYPLAVFFAGIGLGYLFLEVAQLQRLIIFLGHPTYALSVVLFSLLLSSGLGSLATERLSVRGLRPSLLLPLAVLLLVVVSSGLLTPEVIDGFAGARTQTRIIVAAALLAPMGLMMGVPFPLGMKVAALTPNAPTPFFWGINGATSVCASVFAVAIALGWGISASFWVGCASYGIAAAALGVFVLLRRT